MFLKAKQKTKLGHLKYNKRQNPVNFGTAIGGLEVEYRKQLSKDDNIVTLVSAVGSFHRETTVNEMEKLESAKGKGVTGDAIVENLCKVYRATGSVKGIVIYPSGEIG